MIVCRGVDENILTSFIFLYALVTYRKRTPLKWHTCHYFHYFPTAQKEMAAFSVAAAYAWTSQLSCCLPTMISWTPFFPRQESRAGIPLWQIMKRSIPRSLCFFTRKAIEHPPATEGKQGKLPAHANTTNFYYKLLSLLSIFRCFISIPSLLAGKLLACNL